MASLRESAGLSTFLDRCDGLGEFDRQVETCEVRIANVLGHCQPNSSKVAAERFIRISGTTPLWMTWPSYAAKPYVLTILNFLDSSHLRAGGKSVRHREV